MMLSRLKELLNEATPNVFKDTAKKTPLQGESLSFQTSDIKLVAVRLSSTGKMRRILDEDDPKAIAAGITLKMIEDNWFLSPLWKPELGKTDGGGK